MDGDLQEIFSAIGELKAIAQGNAERSAQLDKKCDKLFSKVDTIREEQIEERGKVKLLAEQSAITTASCSAVTKKVEAYENQGKGLRIGIAFASSSGILGLILAAKNWLTNGGAHKAAEVVTSAPVPPQ